MCLIGGIFQAKPGKAKYLLSSMKQTLQIVRDIKIKSLNGDEINIDAQTIYICSDMNNSFEIVKVIRKILAASKVSIAPISLVE